MIEANRGVNAHQSAEEEEENREQGNDLPGAQAGRLMEGTVSERVAQLSVGARVSQHRALQAEGFWAEHNIQGACVIPDPPPPCYRTLDVTGVAGSVALASAGRFPTGAWAVLAGMGAYRLSLGGDSFRERFEPATYVGAHVAVEGQWRIGHAGLSVAFRPTILPRVHGESLFLWPLTAGLRVWD